MQLIPTTTGHRNAIAASPLHRSFMSAERQYNRLTLIKKACKDVDAVQRNMAAAMEVIDEKYALAGSVNSCQFYQHLESEMDTLFILISKTAVHHMYGSAKEQLREARANGYITAIAEIQMTELERKKRTLDNAHDTDDILRIGSAAIDQAHEIYKSLTRAKTAHDDAEALLAA